MSSFRHVAQRRQQEEHEHHDNGRDERESLRCAANGCPALASVSAEGARGLCSWHFGAAPRDWPRITEDVRIHMAQEREKRLMREVPMEHEQPAMTPEALAAVKEKLRATMAALGSRSHGIEWALRLQEIDRNPDMRLPHGKRLTPAQRDMYRTALRNRGLLDGKNDV